MTRRRRNLIALGAIVMLGAVYLWLVAMPRYRTYWANQTPRTPTAQATAGQSVTLDGTRWRVSDVRREHRGVVGSQDDAPIPAGLEVIRVLWQRDAVPGTTARTPSGCDATLIAGDIRWDARQSYGWQPAIDVLAGPDDTTYDCAEAGPTTYQRAFLVPVGVTPEAVDLTVRFEKPSSGDGETQYDTSVLRFALPT